MVPEAERVFLTIGAALMVGCFLAGQSVSYRAIHLLFVLPALLTLSTQRGDICHAWHYSGSRRDVGTGCASRPHCLARRIVVADEFGHLVDCHYDPERIAAGFAARLPGMDIVITARPGSGLARR